MLTYGISKIQWKRNITPCRLAEAVKCISFNQLIIAFVSGCRAPTSSLIEKNYPVSCQSKSLTIKFQSKQENEKSK